MLIIQSTNPIGFIESNVKGVGNLLMWSCRMGVEKIIHISTDEVYGSSGGSISTGNL